MNIPEVSHFESLYPDESRFAELEKVIGFIKQGNSCQIVGIPGVGQSTILKLLAYNRNVRLKHLGENQKQFHFVLTNFSEVRRRPLVDVVKFIFLSLVDSLRYRGLQEEYEKTFAIFKESIALNDELVLFEGLKQALDVLVHGKQLTVVFLFDRFEEYVPMVTDEFFGGLRVLRNRAKYQFSVVFSTTRPLEDLVEPIIMAEYYEFLAGHTVYLPLMDKPGVEFRMQHLESITEKKLKPKLHDLILEVTSGLGKLVKVSTELALTDDQDLPVEKNELVKALLKRKRIQHPLMSIWQAFTPSEQDFLLSKPGSYENSDQDYKYLANVGLLYENTLAIPLLNEFLQTSLVDTEKAQQAEQIVYDVTTNEIKQGSDIISDRLTSSEFKLLRFLVEHTDQVVERDSIINAVWKEAVSTAGVTDQALDQLLFRVRRKIEEDPNNPQHIQTVKGRGIRFTP